jgi:DNA-binding transcriptional ArsR family regulator
MVNYQPARLDSVFAALADPTRRAVIARLAAGETAVSELAHGAAAMSLPGFMKHLGILERAGLLARRKEGRVVTCALAPRALKDASEWLDRYRRFWEERLDALERYLDEEEKAPWPKPASPPSRRSRSPVPSAPRRSGSGGRGPSRKR